MVLLPLGFTEADLRGDLRSQRSMGGRDAGVIEWAAAGAIGGAAWAVRGRSSAVFGPSVWRGDRARRAIALTFDDGPSESTAEILRVLESYGAKATFFQCGAHAERLPEEARAVSAAGHEIGNHTYTHARLWLRSAAYVRAEVERGQVALERVHGRAPRLFRAPYGVRWFGLREVQRRLGLTGVMWTALGRDWKLPGESVAGRLLGSCRNGAIFCLHDGRMMEARPDVRNTVEAVKRLVPKLVEEGWKLETVSQLLRAST
ncbi:MAG: polysaccharide deacetylase family protein [Acidimicrobiia bacterium]|nr:polysaccharide deacetylase family protein [Acidimicrobiia bacterium]